MFSSLKEPSSLVVTGEREQRHQARRARTVLPRHLRPAAVTFDLVVDGHRGIRHPFPLQAVENSAGHRKAHDAENGLDTGKVSQQISTARLQHNQIYAGIRNASPPVSNWCVPL